MRGERQKPYYMAGTIVDLEGQPKYYILPGKLVAVGLISMGLLFIVALMLALMIIKNKIEIDNLKQQVTVEEPQQGTQ